MNGYESEVAETLERLEQLLAESRELEPGQLKAWAASAQPRFEELYAAGTRWLSRSWEAATQRTGPILAWTPSAVRGDPQGQFVWNHADKLSPIFAAQQRERADRIKAAWDEQLAALHRQARERPEPPELELFKSHCQETLERLRCERPSPERVRLALDDLRKELGRLPLSWEQKKALRGPIDAFKA